MSAVDGGGTGPLDSERPSSADEPASSPENAPDESGPVLSSATLARIGLGREDRGASTAGSSNFIGRYEVLWQIGRGGMGTVYLCRLSAEAGFRRLFAMKLLHRHLSADSVAAQRFLDEAHLAGHMHHPNVVGVVDAGFRGSQPYLMMEYVEGASLRELLLAH